MDDSAIMCDEVIDAEAKTYDEEKKPVPTNFNEKKWTVKNKNSIFYLPF